MARAHRLLLAGTLAALVAPPARATDTWSDPFPGIRYLHRSTTEPKEIHALVVDLTHPAIFLRATQSSERGRTVTSFSNLVGAAAAVNGDFYNTDGSYDPVGLAIGEGVQWADGQDPTSHNFIACTALNDCSIDISSNAVSADPSWWSAVGGNTGLIVDGVKWTSAQDTACGSFCTTLHPRTAAGLSQDGNTLILVVVEGRQDPIFGMSLSALATLMEGLGAHTALNLDGGGSSAMVVDGTRVSGRPDNEPDERAVANHLAVIYDPARATTGRLVGYVRENDIYNVDGPIAGASVLLSTGQSTTTSATGFYDFAEVAPGTVTVTASKTGYTAASLDKVVEGGITNWRSIALVAAAADAGTGVDAAVAGDASSQPDAAVAVDASQPPVDSGPAPDAAVRPDGAGADATAGVDRTSAVDSSTPVDGTSPVDGAVAEASAAGDAGLLILDVRARADAAAPAVAGGCDCASAGTRDGRTATALGVLVLGLVVARRRRA